MSKHTSGPWLVHSAINTMSGIWNYRIGPIQFDQHACGKSFGELEANARLISAAPEMLDALKKCRRHMYEHASNTSDGAFDALCSAIQKAEGSAA